MSNQKNLAFDYHLLKLIDQNPAISQRELAGEMGLSLGKINYCLKAFIARGLVKAGNFRRSDNKLAYAYLLTPKGIEEKTKVTLRFFHRVEAEYAALKHEIIHMDRQRFSADAIRISPEVIQKICTSLPDVVAVYLFGSAVSGQMHSESDIDMAVLADSPIDPEQLWKLAQDIAAMLNMEIDLVDLRQASTVMRMQVVQNGKRLYCRDQAASDAFEDFVFSDFARLNEERSAILKDVERRGIVYE